MGVKILTETMTLVSCTFSVIHFSLICLASSIPVRLTSVWMEGRRLLHTPWIASVWTTGQRKPFFLSFLSYPKSVLMQKKKENTSSRTCLLRPNHRNHQPCDNV